MCAQAPTIPTPCTENEEDGVWDMDRALEELEKIFLENDIITYRNEREGRHCNWKEQTPYLGALATAGRP